MIHVQQLTFTYPGKKQPTIKGIDFQIGKGEIFGFLGPSGAGKSTIQKILIGLLKNYQGKVTVLGKELRETKNDYYEQIGVAFEFPNFYSRLTALENLSLFASLYRKKTADPLELLDQVGLLQDAHTKVSDFSKGVKMRLNLCRALLNHPDILFLDEPTSGLDPVNSKVVKDILFQWKAANKTVILTTHNMSAAEELCDRTAFIVDGQIRLIDSPQALKIQYGKKSVRVGYREKNERKTSEFPMHGLDQNQLFLQLLKGNTIETMHTIEPSLEEIFIQVTGRELS
ncbi:ABC transporter ATP-binding protein [Bacillus sp. FJAT-42315]|uniref:ABC transporter ATP-binding protein n=1 Tax=Bacillus sp. FJAT-42315 TaxID=2014077 RepID=UPI000C23D562|nr:ABC transporter ATP-binding protein [Bacillus sp. FJAT-42315]